jgi:hypothetical protein
VADVRTKPEKTLKFHMMNFTLSDRINQTSLKRFAAAGKMDGIKLYQTKKILIIL